MAQMPGVFVEVRSREDLLDGMFDCIRNLFAKEDGGFGPVRSLTRGSAEIAEDSIDGVSFLNGCIPTDNEIIGEKKGVNGRAKRVQTWYWEAQI